MLTKKQHELLCFINDRLEATGISPSFEEMKEALELKSKSGIHRLISALEERGFLRRLPNRARALEILKLPEGVVSEKPSNVAQFAPRAEAKPALSKPLPIAANDVIEIPLHGRIAAGVPIEAMEGASMLSVPAALLGSGEHYALIQRAETAREGDIVVALVEDQDATLKYFRREGAMVRLDPANAAYEPQRYPADHVRIQGRLAGLLRRYH